MHSKQTSTFLQDGTVAWQKSSLQVLSLSFVLQSIGLKYSSYSIDIDFNSSYKLHLIVWECHQDEYGHLLWLLNPTIVIMSHESWSCLLDLPSSCKVSQKIVQFYLRYLQYMMSKNLCCFTCESSIFQSYRPSYIFASASVYIKGKDDQCLSVYHSMIYEYWQHLCDYHL